jgi:hypothetical protein
MYSLSIHFGPSPVPAQFLFKDENKATIAYDLAGNALDFEIKDDFGQHGKFSRADIHAVVLEDMDLGEESRIQRGLSQARGQAKANERAKSDPILKAAMNQRGPGVLTPFQNGQFQ